MNLLSVTNLHKSFSSNFYIHRTPVLTGLSFDVRRGEIFGFLGANGAGKTTTINIIMGLIHPDGGEIQLFDHPHDHLQVKERIGFLPEAPYFYDYLTGREFLDFHARLFSYHRLERMGKIDYLLNLVGLEDSAPLQLRKYSKGMLQRIGIAQALINDPEFVILDEPMSSLDPIGRRKVKDVLLELREQGKTVMFSSHILTDPELICDRVGVLHRGEMKRVGDVEELLKSRQSGYEIQCVGIPWHSLDQFEIISKRGDQVIFFVDSEEAKERALDMIQRRGTLMSLRPRRPSLEDIYLEELEMPEKKASAEELSPVESSSQRASGS